MSHGGRREYRPTAASRRPGLTAFPFWVTVRADGTVAQRLTGELTPDQLDALVASVSTP